MIDETNKMINKLKQSTGDKINLALKAAKLNLLKEYVSARHLYDLRDPNDCIGNTLEGKRRGAYMRIHVTSPMEEISTLDFKGMKRAMQYLPLIANQFSTPNEVSFQNKSERENLSVTHERFDGRIKYHFPYLDVFQKIGETTERVTKFTSYIPGALEELAKITRKNPRTATKVLEEKSNDSVFVDDCIVIYPNKDLFFQLQNEISEYRKRIGRPSMHILRKDIGGQYETDIAYFGLDESNYCSTLDLEAYKNLFPEWKELIIKHHGRIVSEGESSK